LHALGTHLLIELKDCKTTSLDDVEKIEEALLTAARKAKATIIESRFHRFSPFGVSGVVVIAESHLTIHTWPEYGYAAVDIFTCGETLQPAVAAAYIADVLGSQNPSVMEIKRGILSMTDKKLPHKPMDREGVPYERAEELQVVS